MSIEWLLILLTILLSAFFSGSEIAFVTANRLKLEIETRRDSFQARSLNYFVRNPEAFLTTTLIGNNIVNVLYATLMALFLVEPIMVSFENVTGRIPTEFTVMIIQTIIASIIIMIFGEILPKAIFRIQASRMITMLAVPQKVCNWIFKPLILLYNGTHAGLLRLFKYDERFSFLTREKQSTLNEEQDEEGSLSEEERDMIESIFELRDTTAEEILVPRIDIIAIEEDAGEKAGFGRLREQVASMRGAGGCGVRRGHQRGVFV